MGGNLGRARSVAKVLVIGCGFVGEQVLRRCREVGHACYFADREGTVVARLESEGFVWWCRSCSASWDIDVVIICLPSEETSEIGAWITDLAYRDVLISIESTVPPGFTMMCADESKHWELVHAPERLWPGHPEWTVKNISRVVGGVTPEATEAGVAFYRTISDHVFPVANSTVAEMSKLYENAYRAVNIAFVHEIESLCEAQGVRFADVLAAAMTKPFGFQGFFPGPNLGKCLPLAVDLLRGCVLDYPEGVILDAVARVIESVKRE